MLDPGLLDGEVLPGPSAASYAATPELDLPGPRETRVQMPISSFLPADLGRHDAPPRDC